ncbi:TetR family transcriptional regulator [Dyella flagellata]|uniref:TetR family transcriptional regulator n=2 Tax=Dyella flagellata TaxID=1867833 RepID=A0ABQ5XA46_9GAMM|nr:TetR family transcriptional regulator [Dyella flagellata]
MLNEVRLEGLDSIRMSMDCAPARRQPAPESPRQAQFRVSMGYHTLMNVRQKPERTRLSAEDWEDAALNLIAEQGVGALAVEALARQLGVTKGSFYWHFRTREALLQAALERWEQYGEREIIGQIEALPDPRERLPELFRRVAHELHPHRVYAALLKALDHPLVVPVMARVSQRRTEFLHTAYTEAGMEPAEALNRARLTYAAYVGFLQLNFTLGLPRLSHDEFDAYVEHMIATLIPA